MIMKKIILRGLVGFPIGTFISTLITILISLNHNDGEFYSVVPSLIDKTGNELNAFIFQFVLSGILGSVFASGSILFEMDNWSITKQTVSHFLLSTTTMIFVAYSCKWMEPSFKGIVSYIIIFVVIYTVIWLIQFLFWKRKVKELNIKLKK